jgi:RNA polymerase sigma factor (sigma-70 family)
MKREATVATIAGFAVILVVTLQSGLVGLALLPVVLAELAAIIWGHPSSQQGERGTDTDPATIQAETDAPEVSAPLRPVKIRDPIDEEIVRAAANGDEGALTELVKRKTKSLLTTCRRLAKDLDWDGDDLHAETWIVIKLKLKDLRDPAKFDAWAAQIARRLAASRARKESRQHGAELAAYADPTTRSAAEAGLDVSLAVWLDQLPKSSAQLFRMRVFREKSWSQIADHLTIEFPEEGTWTVPKCKARFKKIKKNDGHRLRRLLEDG